MGGCSRVFTAAGAAFIRFPSLALIVHYRHFSEPGLEVSEMGRFGTRIQLDAQTA